MVNEGDSLVNVKILALRAKRQEIRRKWNAKSLRNYLVNQGIAHAFHGNFMWICPVDGRAVENLDVNNLMQEVFGASKSVVIRYLDLTSDEVWNPIGIILLRDALRYALISKVKSSSSLLVTPRCEVYEKNFIQAWRTIGVIAGVDLSRIVRINGNICVCIKLTYECYDGLFRRVDDPSIRVRAISRVTKITSDEYLARMSSIMQKILPLNVFISNKRILFNKWNRIIEKGVVRETLLRWLK